MQPHGENLRDLYARRFETVAAAHEAGVKVYVGTDAGGQLPHGLVGDEVAEFVKAGMTNIEALSAATWGARAWLGRPGIEEGQAADFVVYGCDPRDDVAVLKAPQQVVLRGKVVSPAG